MSESVTLEIHRDRLDGKSPARDVLAKKKCDAVAAVYLSGTVWGCWDDFEWWAEIPAPVKPKRFVVEEYASNKWQVLHPNGGWSAIAIPTREAAQRIADIYEETTP